MSDIKVILDALSILVSPNSQTSSKNITESPEGFQMMLVQNMNELENKINTDPRFHSLRRDDWNTVTNSDQSNVNWQFVTSCLHLLNTLQQSIRKSAELYVETEQSKSKALTPNQAPAMSPDVLSVSQQKTVLTALQFIACLGLCPCFQEGVGIPLHKRSGFSSLIVKDASLLESERCSRMVDCARVLMQCVGVSCLGVLILSRHLSDLLATLLQLSFGGQKQTSGISQSCPSFLPESQNLTPASAVDRVLQQTQEVVHSSVEDIVRSGASKYPQNMMPVSAVDRVLQQTQEVVHTSVEDIVRSGASKYPQNMMPDSAVDRVLQQTQGVADGLVENTKAVVSQSSESEYFSKSCGSSGQNAHPGNSSADKRLQDTDVEFCEQSLQHLLDHVSPPILVRELILLQGGPSQKPVKRKDSGSVGLSPSPPWMRKACGRLLSVILMRSKGVLHVLRGMLDPSSSDPNYWKKCDAVAKVISHCPMSMSSVEEYYKQVCPQILSLLTESDPRSAGHFLRVVYSFIREVTQRHPQLAQQYLVDPVIRPLQVSVQGQDTEWTTGSTSQVVVQHKQLKTCVESLHKIVVLGSECCGSILPYLHPVLDPLCQLFCYCQTSQAGLGKLSLDVLMSFLKQCDQETSLALLLFLALRENKTNSLFKFTRQHPLMCYHSNISGEIEIVYDAEMMSQSEGLDDVEPLVDGLVCIVTNLEKCGLAGEFFLTLLKELTEIISSESSAVTGDDSVMTSGQELLQMEDRQNTEMKMLRKRLVILNLLASMCDKLGPACLKSTRHILHFVMSTLERAVKVLQLTDETLTALFETETISMALGLLTAVMSGEQKVDDSDHVLMQELLPLLEEINLNHPDETIQEMATDIRIAIATRGAVWSDLIKNEGSDFKVLSEKIKNTKKSKTMESKSTKKVLVEVLSELNIDSNIDADIDSNTDSNFDSHNQNVILHAESETVTNPKKKDLKEVCKPNNSSNKDSTELEPGSSETNTIDTGFDVPLSCVSTKRRQQERCKIESGSCKHQPDINKTDSKTSDSNNIMDTNDVTNIDNTVDSSEILESNSTTDTNKPREAELSKHFPESTESSELQQAFTELCDPLIPVRGHGLLRLTKLVQSKSPEVNEKRDTILNVFLENIDHSDSYLYLASVNGLAAMADRLPRKVVPRLAQEFANFDSEERKVKRSVELRLKLGEALVRASRNLGDLIPAYRGMLLAAMLCGVQDSDDDVRASSLSNLAEVCRLLHYSLGPVKHEIFSCCSTLLKTDKSVSVRRAAIVTVTSLLQGLGGDATQVLADVLRDLYRLLKHVSSTDRDDVVQLHTQLALDELDQIARGALFPKQTLEKKITILHPD